MRLYLSSFDVGNTPAALVGLAPRGRMALIMNALDNRPQARAQWFASQSRKLGALGFGVSDFDLRDYFGKPDVLREALSAFDAVWINGGNTFLLRRALKSSGADIAFLDLLARDQIAYAGFSAAAVVLHRDLHGLDAVDDPHDVPDGYPQDVEWSGLGILPFSLVVHYQSDHSESAAVEREIAYYRQSGIPYRTLCDGEALVVDGEVTAAIKVGFPSR